MTRSILCFSVAAVVVGLTACTNTAQYPGYDVTAGDPTPEMLTLGSRHIDAENRYVVTTNENWRMFWGDLSRASLLDRPSRLSPTTMPH